MADVTGELVIEEPNLPERRYPWDKSTQQKFGLEDWEIEAINSGAVIWRAATAYSLEERDPTLTDDFVEAFKETTDFSGGFFHMLMIELPAGVNGDDARVKEILDRCRRWREAKND